MSLEDILDTVERIGELDQRRRETFREEYQAFETNEIETFSETRDCIAAERESLEEVGALLENERQNVEELVEYSEFLSVDQAVRHREEATEKLREHNRHLETFRESLALALDNIDSNLDALENGEAIDADPEPHLEDARDAIEAHNDAVAGLDENLTILNAYLV